MAEKQASQLILYLAAMMSLLVGSCVDFFVPSLPYIQTALNTDQQHVQLIVVAYLVPYGIFQLFSGVITDRVGRRHTSLLGLAGVIITSIAIPFSTSISMLLALRVLQGVFASTLGVINRVLLSDSYSGLTLAKNATYLTFAWAIGPILSPYLGGYLQVMFNWQASFYFLAGYSLLLFILISLLLPETQQTKEKLPLQKIYQQLKIIFSHKGFIAGVFACGFSYSFITMYNVSGPFIIEQVLHYSPVVYGKISLLLGIAWLFGNILCRIILTTPHAKTLVNTVLSVGLLISVLLTIVSKFTAINLLEAFVPEIFFFILGGMLFSYSFGKCLSIFPHMGGLASAAMGATYSTMAAVVAALSTLMKSSTLLPLALGYLIAIIFASYFHWWQEQQLGEKRVVG